MTPVRMWILCAVLLGGFVYSVVALTLATKPVYASSCNCQEALQDAMEMCAMQHSTVNNFKCPVGAGQDHFSFMCNGAIGTNTVPCAF